MEFTNRKSVNDKLSTYDYLAKDNDFIIVTEWTNHDGVDIEINDNKQFSLTFGELDAINYLTKTLDYKFKEKSEKGDNV